MKFLPAYPVERGRNHVAVRRAISNFLHTGQQETHSENALVLHHMLNFCVEQKVGFELKYIPTLGFVVRRT